MLILFFPKSIEEVHCKGLTYPQITRISALQGRCFVANTITCIVRGGCHIIIFFSTRRFQVLIPTGFNLLFQSNLIEIRTLSCMMTQIRYLGQPLILNQSMEVNRTVLHSCALYDQVSMPEDTNLRCLVVSLADLVIYLFSFA